ncbi:MAG: alpha/beta hydrolase [Candidatus Omnitrophica bacterium]|nr:alpha/beta hydrolase [Candidatus Omnitrophota bacterium]
MIYFLVAVLLIFGLVLFSGWIEKNNIYFPDKKIESTPENIGLSYKDVYFRTSDGVELNGWFIPTGKPSRATVLLCHGNAGNISHRLDIIRMLNSLDLNVFIFDYRGYGRSCGTVSERGTYLDAIAAYEELSKLRGVNINKVIFYGRSLGGAVAVELALQKDPVALILDGTFTSTSDMAKEIYPFLPAKFLINTKYDSLDKIKNVAVPKFIIHSMEDEIVLFHHGKELFEKAVEPKEFYRMRGGHNDAMVMYEDEYTNRLDKFLKGIEI